MLAHMFYLVKSGQPECTRVTSDRAVSKSSARQDRNGQQGSIRWDRSSVAIAGLEPGDPRADEVESAALNDFDTALCSTAGLLDKALGLRIIAPAKSEDGEE
jgi:hypothetical protein